MEGQKGKRQRNKELDEVQKFKYLGFTLDRKADYKNHIKELSSKGKMVARRVWGLGERICKNDNKRWMLFKYLVQSVIAYRVELWAWEEKSELEKIMLDYMRWFFNLDFCAPRYVIMSELVMNKLKIG